MRKIVSAILTSTLSLGLGFGSPTPTKAYHNIPLEKRIEESTQQNFTPQKIWYEPIIELPKFEGTNYKVLLEIPEPIPYNHKEILKKIPEPIGHIVDVSKQEWTTYSKGDWGWEADTTFTCSTAKVDGPKEYSGDNKTPEGILKISSIEDSSTWERNGKGYGPYFCRAEKTIDGRHFKGIGIHGTTEDYLLGKPASEGCIRLHNSSISFLVENELLSASSYVGVLFDHSSGPKLQEQLIAENYQLFEQ